MTGKYKFTGDQAEKLSKHGIDLTVYNEGLDAANVVRVHVDEGHFQEFYDKQSTYIYSVIKGFGTFVLNDEKIEAKSGDLIVIPAKTRIYYFGTMNLVLTVVPAFKPENEVHVRFVDKAESPYGN